MIRVVGVGRSNMVHRREAVDFSLHGLANVRLLNAAPRDVEVVARQLGPLVESLNQSPEIIIRFVDRLEAAWPTHYLGMDEAAYTDNEFFVLVGKHKAPVRVQIAFDQIGKQCEIICESGLPAVPLLVPIVNLTALANGALPLHASAFAYNGTGVLATGWSKGGKTETLLAFMSHGASYIGDEWVHIGANGRSMYGMAEPIRIWDWHLRDLPHYQALINPEDRARLRALRFLQSLARTMPNGTGRRSFPLRVMHRLRHFFKQQSFVDVHPQRLFGAGYGQLAGNVDKILLVVSWAAPEITVQPIDPLEIARRMVFSLQHELLDFMAYYLKFRFAFPERVNELIENAGAIQRERLTRLLAGKEAYVVYHPYPVAIPALFEAIHPLL